jgi:Flp pilus assembly protein TadD
MMPAAVRGAKAPLVVLGLLAVFGLLLFSLWKWRLSGLAPLPRDGDPRLSFATPYRNVRPEVSYVGDATCAECHPGQAETYRQHPMGRTLAPVARAAVVERYDRGAHNPFEKFGFEFLIDRQGDRVFHKERRRDAQGRVLTELEAEIHYAIGSGAHGRSYLLQRDDYLFQSHLSWYSQKGIWDLTPGVQVFEHFERPADLQCLFCHCNAVEPVKHTVNRYHLPLFRGHAIGCERCHGPGELHVHSRERGDVPADVDDTIVNPRHLEPALRDAVCQQCHLQGESRIPRRGREHFDYRPGLPLHLFLSVFVRADEFVDNPQGGGHAEQLHQSRCFRASNGKLGCISCHDPHALPAAETKVAHFRSRCLNCHDEKSCGLAPAVRRAQDPADSCIACHMPRSGSKIAHTALTDHRIPRRAAPPAPAPASARRLLPGQSPLVHFHRNLVDPQDLEVARDLGLALAEFGRAFPTLGKRLSALALPPLEAAVQRAPEDVHAREGQGYALWMLERKEEALAAFDAALATAPERELTLTYAAVLAEAMERTDSAIAYWQRAVAVNPWSSQAQYRLARLLAGRQEWAAAVKAGEAALRLNPASEEIRTLLVTCLIRTGNKERARSVFETLAALNPGDQDVLRRWFAEQLR